MVSGSSFPLCSSHRALSSWQPGTQQGCTKDRFASWLEQRSPYNTHLSLETGQKSHSKETELRKKGWTGGRSWEGPINRDWKKMTIHLSLERTISPRLTAISYPEGESQNSFLYSITEHSFTQLLNMYQGLDSYSGVYSTRMVYIKKKKNSMLLFFQPCNY